MAATSKRQFLRAPAKYTRAVNEDAPGTHTAPPPHASSVASEESRRQDLIRRKLGPGVQSPLSIAALECLPDVADPAAARREEMEAKARHEGSASRPVVANTSAAREKLHQDIVDGMRTDVQPHESGAAVVQVLSACTRLPSNLGPALRVLRVLMDTDEDGDAMASARRHARFIMRSGYTSLPCYVVRLGTPFVVPLSDKDALDAVPVAQELPMDDAAYNTQIRRRDRMRQAVLDALRTDRVASRNVATSYGRDAITVEKGFTEQLRGQHFEAYLQYCKAHPVPPVPKDLDDAFDGVPARQPAETCGLVGVKSLHRDIQQERAALCGVCIGLDVRTYSDDEPLDTRGLRPWFILLGAPLPDSATVDDMDAAGSVWQAQAATRVVHIARMNEWIFAWGKDQAPKVDLKSDASRAAARGMKQRKQLSQRSERMRSLIPDAAKGDGEVLDTGCNNDDPMAPLQIAAAGCVQHSGFANVQYTM